MTQQRTYDALKELQRVDGAMDEIREKIASFTPQLETLEEPARDLAREVEAVRSRRDEMSREVRRLERSAEEKRARVAKLEERLRTVQNVREEAAVQAELDLVRRAREADDKEALNLMDQVQRSDEQVQELEDRLAQEQEQLEPRRQEIESERQEAQDRLDELERERQDVLSTMNPEDRKMYESFRAGGRSTVLAHLLGDGACGHCYNVLPLQRQREVAKGDSMIRCEECGVVLAPPEVEGEE